MLYAKAGCYRYCGDSLGGLLDSFTLNQTPVLNSLPSPTLRGRRRRNLRSGQGRRSRRRCSKAFRSHCRGFLRRRKRWMNPLRGAGQGGGPAGSGVTWWARDGARRSLDLRRSRSDQPSMQKLTISSFGWF